MKERLMRGSLIHLKLNILLLLHQLHIPIKGVVCNEIENAEQNRNQGWKGSYIQGALKCNFYHNIPGIISTARRSPARDVPLGIHFHQ